MGNHSVLEILTVVNMFLKLALNFIHLYRHFVMLNMIL